MSRDEPEWVSLVLEAYTKPNQTKPRGNQDARKAVIIISVWQNVRIRFSSIVIKIKVVQNVRKSVSSMSECEYRRATKEAAPVR